MIQFARSILIYAALLISPMFSAVAENYVIAPQQVLDFLGSPKPGSMDVPRAVSSVPQPQLKVEEKVLHDTLVSLRVVCANRHECLPFLISLHFENSANARDFADGVPITRPPRMKPVRRGPNLVHSGSIVRLEIDSGATRLNLYVRCLQAGAEGAKVRALDDQMHKIYLARVVGNDFLRWEP